MLNRSSSLLALALFLLALAVRLPGLDVFFTADEFLWVDRSRNFLGGLLDPDFECLLPSETKTNALPGKGLACTLRTGHPGVLTMWTGAAGITLQWLARPADDARSLLQFTRELPVNPVERRTIAPVRLPTVVITSLFVVAVYLLLGKLFKAPIPLLAAILTALNPFHVALSRVLHHDALSTTFIVTSALSLIIYYGADRRRRWLVLAGALAGAAMLSKSTGLFLVPYAGLLGLWSLMKDEGGRMKDENGKKISSFILHPSSFVLDGFIWAGVAALTFFLLWPAMWVIPAQALNTIYAIGFKYASGGHAKGVFFFGDVLQDPGPWFYPVTWFFRTNFWAMAGLLAAVAGSMKYAVSRKTKAEGRRQKAEEQRANDKGQMTNDQIRHSPFTIHHLPFAWIAAFVIFFLIAMTLGEKKQDRYILPLYPMLDIVAAIGLWNAASWAFSFFQRSAVSNQRSAVSSRQLFILHPSSFILIILVTNLTLTLWRAPYYFTYYNPLAGGIQAAVKTLTVGWGDGLNLAAEYLNAKPDAAGLKAASWYGSTFAPYFDGETIRYSDQKGNALAGDYTVFYINQRQRRYPDDEIWRYLSENYALEKTIQLSGVDYAWIFTAPGIGHYVEDQTYKGIGGLLGWNWRGNPNPDEGPVLSGSQLDFSLFWEYLGKAPEETFFARLIGADGNIWAETKTQPIPQFSNSGAWRQGQIIEEEGSLLIPAETPPGDYALQIGFYTRAPAVPSGELTFPTPAAPLNAPLQTIHVDTFSFPPPTEPVHLLDLALHAVPPMNAPLPTGHPFASPEVGETWDGQKMQPVLNFDLLFSAPMGTSHTYRAEFELTDQSGQAHWKWEARPLISFLPTDDWPAGTPLRTQWHLPLNNPRTPGGVFTLRLRLLDETGNSAEFDLPTVLLPGRERNFTPPHLSQPLDAVLGETIALLGVGGAGEQGRNCFLVPLSPCPLTLYWQSLATIEQNYTVFAQLLDAGGQVIAQQDAQPMHGNAPTSTWTPGEIIADAYTLQLPAELPPGPYRLIAGMYFPETGQRLPVSQNEEQRDFVLLWEGE